MNKDIFCENFEKYLGRPWISTAEINYDEFKNKFANERKIVYKPRSLSGRKGIKVFESSDSNIDAVYKQLYDLPAGIAEGFIAQHHEMRKLSINCVNTVRVVTINTSENLSGIEKSKLNIIYAGLRMGNGDGYVDNLHSGGMIAAVDIQTGLVTTDGVDFNNRVFIRHPDTDTVIRGFQIPYFEELKQMIDIAGKDIEGYFGWDIAVTETGPVIVEVNTNPGAECLQIPYVPQKKE